jgi:nanoRNase/pAp phosphatase (c-di-AMP/oligoRNAs hydrolase)
MGQKGKMELSPKQQFLELAKKSENIFILIPNANPDAIGASAALSLVLQKISKNISVIMPKDEDLGSFQFLPKFKNIHHSFDVSKDIIIDINCSPDQLPKIGYKIIDSKPQIIISPKSGDLKLEDVKISQSDLKIDLIIVLDCADLDLLGEFYENNAQVFYQTPVVNIDHHSNNNFFGKVNLVDQTASSTCEILVSLIEALGQEQNLFDEIIATCLLTGLIFDTNSFQNVTTTPKAFTVAAQLVAAGANQQEIISNLFKSRTVASLRLWGTILANIREDKDAKIIWSTISARDLEQTNSTTNSAIGSIDELFKVSTDADFVVLLSEYENGIMAAIRAKDSENLARISQKFEKSLLGESIFDLKNLSLAVAEKNVLDAIRGL